VFVSSQRSEATTHGGDIIADGGWISKGTNVPRHRTPLPGNGAAARLPAAAKTANQLPPDE
jgi:hypothetical protein